MGAEGRVSPSSMALRRSCGRPKAPGEMDLMTNGCGDETSRVSLHSATMPMRLVHNEGGQRNLTRTAREVLADCEIALQMLEAEQDLGRWRVHWAGALALVRAVGHVLTKVDGADPTIRKQVDIAYRRWKSDRAAHAVFWEFIEEERNNILKEYRFNLHPLDSVDVAVMMTVRHPVTGELSQIPQVVPIGENIYRPVLDGYSEGNDARDVYREALDWWNAELTLLEDALTAGGAQART